LLADGEPEKLGVEKPSIEDNASNLVKFGADSLPTAAF
jgi:hypothetical protein